MSKETKKETFQIQEPLNKKKDANDGYDEERFKGKCMDPRLLTFCITNFFYNVAISQITPFYPGLAHNEAGLDYTQIGLVFGVNPMGSIVFSLIVGRFIQQWGRKRLLIIGLLMQAVVQTLFGCLNFMTGNKELFFAVSLCTRIFQGVSRSMYATVTFAYVPVFWPNEFQKKLGVMESMTALGLLCGPIIGSALNYVFGYSIPFFLMASVFFFAQIPICMHMPDDNQLKNLQQKKKLPIIKAFTSVKVLVTILNVLSITCGYVFIAPIFVNHCLAFGHTENIAAILLTIPALFYVILCYVVPRLQKYAKKTFIMSCGLLICFVGNMLEAPFWGGTGSMVPVIFGLMLVGTAQAFSMLPSIPQISEFLGPVITDPKYKNNLTDIGSALFIMSMGIGQLLGQFLGGVIYDAFGGNVNLVENPQDVGLEKQAFRNALEVLGMWQLFAGTMFFFFGDGYKGWQDMLRRCFMKEGLKGPDNEMTVPLRKENVDHINQGSETLSNSGSTDEVYNDNDSESDKDDQELSNYKPIRKSMKIKNDNL